MRGDVGKDHRQPRGHRLGSREAETLALRTGHKYRLFLPQHLHQYVTGLKGDGRQYSDGTAELVLLDHLRERITGKDLAADNAERLLPKILPRGREAIHKFHKILELVDPRKVQKQGSATRRQG